MVTFISIQWLIFQNSLYSGKSKVYLHYPVRRKVISYMFDESRSFIVYRHTFMLNFICISIQFHLKIQQPPSPPPPQPPPPPKTATTTTTKQPRLGSIGKPFPESDLDYDRTS